MAKTKQAVTIKTNEENPEPLEIIAQAVIDISKAFERIQKSRLSQRLIILLIQDQTKISHAKIRQILEVVPKLKDIYLKKLPTKP